MLLLLLLLALELLLWLPSLWLLRLLLRLLLGLLLGLLLLLLLLVLLPALWGRLRWEWVRNTGVVCAIGGCRHAATGRGCYPIVPNETLACAWGAGVAESTCEAARMAPRSCCFNVTVHFHGLGSAVRGP